MNMPQNFRSAFNGFNREDVVHYIEYINARHHAEVKQLKSELDLLQNMANNVPNVSVLEAELEALREERDLLLAKIAELEAQETVPETAPAVSEAAAAPAVPAPVASAELELEAYRRAERMERIARERAEQVYHQANAALADASVKVDAAALQISQMSEAVLNQLTGLQQAVNNSKQALADASATMYTIRPTQD